MVTPDNKNDFDKFVSNDFHHLVERVAKLEGKVHVMLGGTGVVIAMVTAVLVVVLQ
jgi:hypothetical protein